MANLGYEAKKDDAEGHRSGFEMIPPGWYKVVINHSEVKPTKKKDGSYLELKYQLQDGTNREVVDRLNVSNRSEVAQKIGRGALGKIIAAIGIAGNVSDSNVLHGRPFEAKILVEEFESNTEQGKMLQSNKVTDYRAVGSTVPTATGSEKKKVW